MIWNLIGRFLFSYYGKMLWLGSVGVCIGLAPFGVMLALGYDLPQSTIGTPTREILLAFLIMAIVYFGGGTLVYLVTYLSAIGRADESN